MILNLLAIIMIGFFIYLIFDINCTICIIKILKLYN